MLLQIHENQFNRLGENLANGNSLSILVVIVDSLLLYIVFSFSI